MRGGGRRGEQVEKPAGWGSRGRIELESAVTYRTSTGGGRTGWA